MGTIRHMITVAMSCGLDCLFVLGIAGFIYCQGVSKSSCIHMIAEKFHAHIYHDITLFDHPLRLFVCCVSC